jgi:ATP-dependent Lon protease
MTPIIPDEIPVMTLPNTVFFPQTVLPLHILEERYRNMLAETLRTHRVFAVAALSPSTGSFNRDTLEPPHRIATAGVISACQKNENGTANLLLEGLARVEIEAIVREAPYRVIRVKPVPEPTSTDEQKAEKLRRDLLRVFRLQRKLGAEIPAQLTSALDSVDDVRVLCDMAVFAIAGSTQFKQRILETNDLVERVESAIAHFQKQAELLGLDRILRGRLHEDDVENN